MFTFRENAAPSTLSPAGGGGGGGGGEPVVVLSTRNSNREETRLVNNFEVDNGHYITNGRYSSLLICKHGFLCNPLDVLQNQVVFD